MKNSNYYGCMNSGAIKTKKLCERSLDILVITIDI